jgi:DNA-binding transcriptional LysR family regulator
MRDQMEMRDIEAFLAVVETSSFTTAAQRLFLTQPTVSARIASLEAALDAKLLDRGPGGVRPTPTGEVFLPLAQALLRGREEAFTAVQDFLGRPGGTLVLGASSIPGSYLLPAVLAKLRATHPQLRARLIVEDTDKTVESLRRGAIELAVVGRSVSEEGLVGSEVGKDEIVLIATPEVASRFKDGKKSALDAIVDLPLILREPGSATRAAALQALEEAGIQVDRLNIVLEIGGNAAAREAVLADIGAAFLSKLAVQDQVASGRLLVIPVLKSPLLRPLVLVTRVGRTLSPGATELVRLLMGPRAG